VNYPADGGGGGGSGSVSIDIGMLTAARKSLTTLASAIDQQRARATQGTPVALPSLQDGARAAQAAAWLTDQAPKLQTLIDLATLLDTKGTGSASYTGSGSFSDAEDRLGHELGKQLNDLDIDDAGDRARYQKLADMMATYKDNRWVTTATLDELGTDGARELIEKLAAMTGDPPTSNYWQNIGPPDSPGDELQALAHLQSSVASGLTGMLGSATTNDWVDSEDWGKGIAQDWVVASILLRSADKNNTVLGPKFTQTVGHELMDWEAGDPMRHQGLTGLAATFGGETLNDDNGDALRQLIKAGDNSPDSAQAIMLDQELASYLMHDRLTSEHLASSMDDLVRIATVDSATDPTKPRAQNAASISSWTLHYAAENDLDDNYDEELGGIVGTYITDAYQLTTGVDVHDIVGDVPPFHLSDEDSQSDLTAVLQHIGGNKTATSVIGDHATRLNQMLIDHGAQASLDGRASNTNEFQGGTGEDPLYLQLHGAAGFRGYLEDELAQGLHADGVEEEEARRKTAELFTLPLDYVPTDPLGKVGGAAADYLIGDIKDQIIDGYVGNPAHAAAAEGNEHYLSAKQATKIQAYYALVEAQSDHPTDASSQSGTTAGHDGGSVFDTQLRHDWPRDSYGNLKTPGQLTHQEMKDLVAQHGDEPGVAGATSSEVDNSWDSDQNAKGDLGG
jgi:hypothetical protein